MADKSLSQFERRSQGAAPETRPRPANRSHEVVLLVMGTIAVGSTAYSLMPRECTPAQPGTMPTLSSPSECPQGSSSSSHGGSSGSRYSYSSGGRSSSSTPASTTDASSSTVRRGGFGGFAQGFSSHFSFGS